MNKNQLKQFIKLQRETALRSVKSEAADRLAQMKDAYFSSDEITSIKIDFDKVYKRLGNLEGESYRRSYIVGRFEDYLENCFENSKSALGLKERMQKLSKDINKTYDEIEKDIKIMDVDTMVKHLESLGLYAPPDEIQKTMTPYTPDSSVLDTLHLAIQPKCIEAPNA